MLLFIAALMILALLYERISLKTALKKVSYDASLSELTVEPDEDVLLISVISNNKRMPVPFLRMREFLPPNASFQGKKISHILSEKTTIVEYTMYLMPFQRVTRALTFSMPNRGCFTMTGSVVHGGDFLGINESVCYFELYREIVVFPRRAESQNLNSLIGTFIGQTSVRRFIIEDPVLTVGFREYTGREPQKNISWTRTAQSGSLMVKSFDYTTDISAAVVLNADCMHEKFDKDRLEACFSIARTVCEGLERDGVEFGMICNSIASGAYGAWSNIHRGLGKAHLRSILELLGRATYQIEETFEETLTRALKRAEAGMSHILITPFMTDDMYGYVRKLKIKTGADVLVLTPDVLDTVKEAEAV